jgi:hypothetical protein
VAFDNLGLLFVELREFRSSGMINAQQLVQLRVQGPDCLVGWLAE